MRGRGLARIPSRGAAGQRRPGSEKITARAAPSQGSAMAASKTAAPVPTGAIFEATGRLFVATGAIFVATGAPFVATGAISEGTGAISQGIGTAVEGTGAIPVGTEAAVEVDGGTVEGIGVTVDSTGATSVEDVSLKYRESLPPAREFSFFLIDLCSLARYCRCGRLDDGRRPPRVGAKSRVVSPLLTTPVSGFPRGASVILSVWVVRCRFWLPPQHTAS